MKTFSDHSLVLKIKNIGETDLIITLLTASQGKIVAIAKGVRRLKSTRRAYLEPGNIVKAFFVNTKSMPLLTQAQLVAECTPIRQNLKKITQLMQFLEILDKLFVEEEIEDEMFELVLNIRSGIVTTEKTKNTVLIMISELIEHLGYQPLADTEYQSLNDYASALTEKPMRSWEFLHLKK